MPVNGRWDLIQRLRGSIEDISVLWRNARLALFVRSLPTVMFIIMKILMRVSYRSI
jgi:hypothetical protein